MASVRSKAAPARAAGAEREGQAPAKGPREQGLPGRAPLSGGPSCPRRRAQAVKSPAWPGDPPGARVLGLSPLYLQTCVSGPVGLRRARLPGPVGLDLAGSAHAHPGFPGPGFAPAPVGSIPSTKTGPAKDGGLKKRPLA